MESDPIGGAMMMIGDILFPNAAARRSALSILGWWEARRGTFNLIVGGTGLVTLLVVRLMSLIPPGVPFMFDWRVVVAYGLLANVCYSFGFMLETLLARLWGDEVAPVGPTLFRHGLVFSVGLTLLPIGVAWVGYLFGAVKWLLS